MSRGARVILGALVLASVAAFFVTQHLKSTTPIIVPAAPFPVPGTISTGNPGCGGRFERATISFYLLHREDDVSMYVVDSGGTIVRTLASAIHLPRRVRHVFTWDGRSDAGRTVPDGVYVFRVALTHQNRTIDFKSTIRVKITAPHPMVRRVSTAGGTPALLPSAAGARIDYSGDQGHLTTVLIYRRAASGPAQPVASFLSPRSPAVWDGRIHGHPAPAGTYFVGLSVTDAECNTGRYPAENPPAAGATAGAGVTVRPLAALPPLGGVAAGLPARVLVDARRQPYNWALRPGAGGAVLGHGPGTGPVLNFSSPRSPGLYRLAVATGSARVEVPVIVHASSGGAGVLVVLPALTWQGRQAQDLNGDGSAINLDDGGPVDLAHPFSGLLPPDAPGEAALLAYLTRAHLSYDVTTDLGLLAGAGPGLGGHSAVVLAGSERWAPATLTGRLARYVSRGGRVLSLGADSLRRSVTLMRDGGSLRATDPGPEVAIDALGGRHGPALNASAGLVLKLNDALGLFTGTSGALPGFGRYEPVIGTAPPAGRILSAMGEGPGSAAIAGWRLGSGLVIESGVADFTTRLAGSVDARELIGRLWSILSR